MIRVTKPLGRYVLAALHFLRVEEPDAMREFHAKQLWEWAETWLHDGKLTEAQAKHLADSRHGDFPAQIGIDAAIDRLEKQVSTSRESIGDIIDGLATVLMDTLGRNRISGEFLLNLRQVILRGGEQDTLKKLLKEKPLFCAGENCNHKFTSTSQEAVTISFSHEIGYTLYCSRCSTPRVLACGKGTECSEVTPVSTEFHTAWVQASAASNCGKKHPKASSPERLEEVNGRAATRPPLDVARPGDILGAPPLTNRAPRFRTRPSVTPQSLHDAVQMWALPHRLDDE